MGEDALTRDYYRRGLRSNRTENTLTGLNTNGTESSVKEIPHKIRGQSSKETAFPPSSYSTDPDLALRAPVPLARPDPSLP
jgi:hypothetical protein